MTDPLSDVLDRVRLTGAVYFDVNASAPWVAEAPAAAAIAPHVARGAEHVIEFHVVARGTCWGGIAGEPATELRTGDVIVFPQGDPHTLSSAPGLRGVATDPFPERTRQIPITLRLGGDAEPDTRVICGFLTCDRQPFNPLLAALPRMLHDAAGGGRGGDGAWISRFIEQALDESAAARPGGKVVLTKLSELMFLDVVRRYLASLPAERTGWLAALNDPIVGRAIALLHEKAGHAWTVDELARAAGASRSALAERFTGVVGLPPMQYLAQWRIQLAAALLARSSAGIGEVAAEVGYESEAAFHRAFKKAVGLAPGAWRRRQAA